MRKQGKNAVWVSRDKLRGGGEVGEKKGRKEYLTGVGYRIMRKMSATSTVLTNRVNTTLK